MNKQQLAAKIWESANQMRSKIEANEYKDYILGFIFYKYLSDKEVQFAKKQDFEEQDIKNLSEKDTEVVKFISKEVGYFIAYEHLFSTWLEIGKDFEVAHVRDALSAFSRLIHPYYKPVYEGIFDTLQTGLSKLGDTSGKQTKAISELIYLIKDIPMDGKQGYDVLGFIYEYLISMFAANAGKKAGEFYTPHEVSLLMSEIVADHVKDQREIEIYDPTSGSGSLLINIGSSVVKHMKNKNNIKYYAQELKKNTYNLTRMNLVMRGILPVNIVTRNGDTLEDDWPYFDENDPINSYNPLYVDAVVSNPPYSQKWDSHNKETDPRYARFGLAPKTKADYAFLLHDLYHLKPNGIMTIVLPHGVLFRGGEEGKIRKNLIEYNHIDTIIGLPANIFFGTGIPTVILVLKQNRQHSDVLIVDASKHFIKEGKNNKLQASDIKRITDTVIERKTTQKYSRLVSKEEIRSNDYNLNIPRYVDSTEKAETWDVFASMFGGIPSSELDELDVYWNAFPSLRLALFAEDELGTTNPKTKDINNAIQNHKEILSFTQNFSDAFADFGTFMKKELLEHLLTLPIAQEQAKISTNIFQRLQIIPLIDKYEAYQILDDQWHMIAGDLEVIQIEGFNSTKTVDPNIVVKKIKGKDTEVQEGWKGHIIPFALVQDTYFKKELQEITQKEERLIAISARYDEIIDSFTTEEKEADTLTESQGSFVSKAVGKEAKQIQDEIKQGTNFDKESYERKILEVDTLMTEEKKLKKQINSDSRDLHMETKETIEALTDEQVHHLLEQKWIVPLCNKLAELPYTIIQKLTAEIEKLIKKYDATYTDIVHDIEKTEKELASMLDGLTGNERDMKGILALKNLLEGE